MLNFTDYLHEAVLSSRLEDFLNKFPFADHKVIVFDVETTGINPRLPHVQITELSAITVDLSSGELGRPFIKNIKLNPQTVLKVKDEENNPPAEGGKIFSLKKILDMQSYNPDLAHHDEVNAVVEFKDFVESEPNAIMVAHNATFDMGMINGLLQREKLSRIRVPVIDTLKLAKVFLEPVLKMLAELGDDAGIQLLNKLKDSKNIVRTRLSDLGNAFDVGTAQSHVAINDVMQTAILLKKMAEFIKSHINKLDSEKMNAAFVDSKKNWNKFVRWVNLQRRGVKIKKDKKTS